jgi:EAL and modified HD-GYP domain-containing signal transduction protein
VSPVTPTGNGNLVHIGRQAIYDRTGAAVAYELLFRGSPDATGAERRNAHATSQVILSSFAEFGLDQLVGDLPCFLNITREFLVGELPLPFPPGQVVLEILETVEVDDEVVAGVAALVERGFRIALDDFVWGQGHEKLLSLASYVKVDMLGTDPQAAVSTVFAVRRYPGITLVAERVESPELIDLAHRLGFDLFQGHAYGRPQTLSAVTFNPSRIRRLELFGALAAVDIELEQVVRIVTGDPALSYRVLQATNSAAVGLPRKVSSVREAIMVLGTDRIRQWVALMLVSDISEATEQQLSTMMSRAKLCQTVAERLDVPSDTAFTVGLLASVAELLDEPVHELVTRLPLAPEIVAALVHGSGRLGQVLSMVRAYERTDMSALSGSPVSSAEMARAYLSALGWSKRTMAGVLAGRATARTARP